MEAGDERQSSTAAIRISPNAEIYEDDLNCEAPEVSVKYNTIESEDSSGSETDTASYLRSDCWSSWRTETDSYVDYPDFPEEADAELMALAQNKDTLRAMATDGWKCDK